GLVLVRYRWLVLATSIVVVVVAAMGMGRLTSNPDSRVFFSKDNPQMQALDQFENTYSKNDNLMYVIAPKSGDVFSAQTLDGIRWLTEESWKTPYSSRVDSITNFQYSHADGDDLIVEDMWPGSEEAAEAGEDMVERARRIVLDRPTLVNRIVSPDGSVTAVGVLVITPGDSLDEVPSIARFARERAAEFRQRYPDIDLYMTGGVMIDMAFSEVPEADVLTLFPIMILLVLVVIGIAVRSVLWTLLTLFSVIFSVFTTLGLAGWAGVVMNAGTMGSPIIILTLAIAHGVHIMVTAKQGLQSGLDKHAAIVESMRVNMAPVFITSVTTAIGFMSMNFSDAPPFRLLGNLVATGVMVAFVLSVTLLPAVMAVLPAPKGQGETLGSRAMARFADFVIGHRGWLLWASGAVIVALGIGTTQINLDDDFIKYFDERYPIRTDSDFTEDNLTGINVLEYSVPAGREGGVADPKYLADLERFAEWFRTQPKVSHVWVLTDTIKRLNENLHSDDPAHYRIPENAQLAAQYLLLYEMSVPFGLSLNNQVNVGKSATRVTVTVVDITSKEMRELDVRAQAWLAENIPDRAAPGTGLSLMFAYISERNINSMLTGSIIALLLISAVLIIALRSLPMGLVSLIPNLFPAAMA
ncbi:MAG TPA: MMPL family transporter, partial [Alphaproteobacteria bacterium]|nr:MMPL family transporter [Alphaproteobacteria bacterium]